MSPQEKKGPIIPLVVIGVLALLAAGYYYWVTQEQDKSAATADRPVVAEPTEPPIRHPIQRDETAAVKPLPSLAESDGPMREAGADLIGVEALEKFFNLNSIARRVVVTIDDLPRKKLSQRYNVAKPVAGEFLIYGKDDRISLSPDNFRRYTAHVKLLETVDAKKLVAVYAYFYPLFQEEYRNLGYPKKYFNDRVVEAIDDLLATPELKQPVRLTQPKVMYEFADPMLESLSAGQKIMIRMGPENAAGVKQKLQEIRAELTASR